MGNEITVAQKSEVIQTVDMQTITEYLDTTGLTESLLPKEKAMFVNMAQLYGLNPFKREIYCNVYGEGQYRQCSIITGYEVYLKRAERIGKLDGWHTQEMGSVKDGTFAVKVTIYRKDWSHPFEHTVYYTEVKQTKKDGSPNKFWATQPRFMTKKVAIAQAFRMCFPDEFGGMPYMADELGVEESAPMVERNITPEPQENTAPVAEQKAEPKPTSTNPNQPSESYLNLEHLLDEYGLDLRHKKLAEGQKHPYTLAKELLDNPNATEDELAAMYNRCLSFLSRKGIQITKGVA